MVRTRVKDNSQGRPEVTDEGCAVSVERHRESDRCSLGTHVPPAQQRAACHLGEPRCRRGPGTLAGRLAEQ